MLTFEIQGLDSTIVRVRNIKQSLLNRAIMGKLAAQATSDIKQRTKEGKDVNEKKFAAYSPIYILQKKARGGRFFKSGVVNLDDTGHMQSAVQWKVSNGHTAEIVFTDNEAALKASGHQHGNLRRGLPQRKFFGIGKRGEASLNKILADHLNGLVDGRS